ncbi:8-oxoguanine DNA glycosylase [Bradyrhizobium sp. USDA 4508]
MDLPRIWSDRVPDAEVIPGVKWGRPEWVPSAAFWAAMSDLAEGGDNFVCTEATLKEQVGFCLLGGFGITAEMNHAIFDRLESEGMFRPGYMPVTEKIERLLRAPVEVEGRFRRYRFPYQRSKRLASALRLLEEGPPSADDPRKFRSALMKIPGVGPKTASWITRNWLGSDEVAILDIHIIRAGVLIGLFDRRQTVPRDYDAMEARFLAFAAALNVRPSLLDAIMWREMRQLGRGKV